MSIECWIKINQTCKCRIFPQSAHLDDLFTIKNHIDLYLKMMKIHYENSHKLVPPRPEVESIPPLLPLAWQSVSPESPRSPPPPPPSLSSIPRTETWPQTRLLLHHHDNRGLGRARDLISSKDLRDSINWRKLGSIARHTWKDRHSHVIWNNPFTFRLMAKLNNYHEVLNKAMPAPSASLLERFDLELSTCYQKNFGSSACLTPIFKSRILF